MKHEILNKNNILRLYMNFEKILMKIIEILDIFHF